MSAEFVDPQCCRSTLLTDSDDSERTKMQPFKMQSIKMQPIKIQPIKMQPFKMQPIKMQPIKMSPIKMQHIKIKPLNVFAMLVLHVLAVLGFQAYMTSVGVATVLYYFALAIFTALGITAGAHRLWSHRSYKAKLPLRLLLALFFTMALQNSLYTWCRDHRVHHKYSDTDADPHNSKRGFFFAHMGWLLCSKHPDVRSKGKSVDCSDLLADPVVRFQHRYFVPMAALGFYLTTMAPVWCWAESPSLSFLVNVYRLVYVWHNTWLINSWAHRFGMRPYDKSINATETAFAVIQTYGEGYHNYHHTFPHDYSASELDWRYSFNVTTLVIDTFAALGWAYNRRKVNHATVVSRVQRTGQGAHYDRMHSVTRRALTMLIATILATLHLWAPLLARMHFSGLFQY